MIRAAALLIAVLGACAASVCAEEVDDKKGNKKDADKASYLDAKGRLAETLVLRDSQGGFAGFSGWLWTVEPNGAWRKAPFLNEDVREAEQSGKLSAKELAALAAAFKQHKLLELPKNIGGEPMTNPHVFSLTFGEHTCELVLGAGEDLPETEGEETKELAGRFTAIARAIQAAAEKSVDDEKPKKE